jgi:hypothetical protein
VRLEYDYIGLNGLSVVDGQPSHGGGAGGAAGGGGGGRGGGGGAGAGGGIHGIVSDTFNVNNASVQMLTVGVHYFFNWSPAPAAVVTKY